MPCEIVDCVDTLLSNTCSDNGIDENLSDSIIPLEQLLRLLKKKKGRDTPRLTSRLVPFLADLMSARVLPDLPSTFDADQDDDNACVPTLSKTSMLAASVYTRLLSDVVVEMHAVTALQTLIRRWNQECSTVRLLDLDRQKKTTGYKRQSKTSPLLQPLKRTRGYDDEVESDGQSSFENDSRSDELQVQEVCDTLTPVDLTSIGLDIALELAKVPLHPSFYTWNLDARSSVLESIILTLSTAAALEKYDCSSTRVVEQVTTTLEHCFPNNVSAVLHRETTVIIQLGLLSTITRKEKVPNGEVGTYIVIHLFSVWLATVLFLAESYLLEESNFPTLASACKI
jgi:hypothetical protein